MATASYITMLREISAAGDRERTGALDVEWEGARASLFFMFGHPSHIVFETVDGNKLAGDDALSALVHQLPTEFRVAPWRRAMVTEDTLHCSAEDLMSLFHEEATAAPSDVPASEPVEALPVAAAGGEPTAYEPAPPPALFLAADEPSLSETSAPPQPPQAPAAVEPPDAVETPVAEAAPEATPDALEPAASAAAAVLSLEDFPLLPMGTVLWTDAMSNVVNLEAVLPRLPDCQLVLAGPSMQAVIVVAGGAVADAAYADATSALTGDDAAKKLLQSTDGHLTAHRVDDAALAAALPTLWRGRRVADGLPAGWLHTEDILAEVRTSERSCAMLVDTEDRGVVLFHGGELVAVYTAEHRWPATSMTALRDLLHQPGARVSVIDAPPAVAEPEHEAAPVGAITDAPAEPETPTVDAEDAVVTAEAAIASVAIEDSVATVEPPAEAETALAEPHAEAETAITEPHAEAETAIAEPHAEAEVALADPHAEAETAVAEPPAEAETAVAEPPAEAETALAEPHAEAETAIAEPHAEAEPGITEPHAEAETGITEPHAEADTALAEPHAEAETGITEPHAEADTALAEPHAEAETAITDPHDEAETAVATEPHAETESTTAQETADSGAAVAEPVADAGLDGAHEPEAGMAIDEHFAAAEAVTSPAENESAQPDGLLLVEDPLASDGPSSGFAPTVDDDVATDEWVSPHSTTASEPELFELPSLQLPPPPAPTEMEQVEAREATEFVPARLDIDVAALRTELIDIAVVWLGADDAAPVALAIGAARPGVDDFVSTIAAIGAMEIPGHEAAVVRAMAREMHYRASEVLCGV